MSARKQQTSINAFFRPLHASTGMDGTKEGELGPSKRSASAQGSKTDVNLPAKKVRDYGGIWLLLMEEQKLKTTMGQESQAGPSKRPVDRVGTTPAQKTVEGDSTSGADSKPEKEVQIPRKKIHLTQQQRRNQLAREAQAKPGSTYQLRMTCKRDKLRTNPHHNTDIAAVLSNIFWCFAARFETIREGIDARTDSVFTIKLIVKKSCQSDHMAPIPDDNAVWTHLQPAVDVLADCAMNPFQFDVNHWVTEGVLVEADDMINCHIAEYYLRVITFANSRALRDAICQYISTFPADMSVAILWLALLGHPADDIKVAVRSSLVSRGYILAATELVALLDEDNVGSLNLGIKPDTPVYLPYAGFTIAGSPRARLEDDKLDDCRCFPNFLSAMDQDVSISTYRFSSLDYPAPMPLCYHTDPIFGQIEAICIDALCTATLNSRHGAETLECCAPILFTAKDPQLTQSIRALEDDEFNVLKHSIPKEDFMVISTRAFENMKCMSADVVCKVDGAVPLVDIFKDITAEEHSGKTEGTHADDSGEALCLHQHIPTLINKPISFCTFIMALALMPRIPI
ncbi:hypothetical protein BD410DRAFT_809834 [Rickenella mellea]|uniref:Uncharacterized protein n=1 Tax=Rickenella mellea TaxID=50990 RepID=A0A4Y7PG23_9AGAM|nr:hypothetical protein BD410DRAFT_809834 [Rickenella mellea]